MPNEVLVRPSDIKVGDNVTVWSVVDGHRTFGQGGTVLSCDPRHLVIVSPVGSKFVYDLSTEWEICQDVPWPLSDCIEFSDDCSGDVEFFSPRGLGGPLRCEYHRDRRMESYEDSMERYADSDIAPSWFDPSACGERWEDD